MSEPQEIADERQEFLEQQLSGLGATDSPKILGFSKYGTSLSVYDFKVNGPQEGEMSLPAWLGLKMQNTVGELYTTATGRRLRAANGHYRSKRLPIMVCHLDFRVAGNPKLLVEAKTRAHMGAEWGEDGSTEIPADIWVQVQHEMAVVDATQCDVAVLFGHHTFRVYPIPRDDEFIARLEATLAEWWQHHYIARVPPLPSGRDVDEDILRRRHPEDREPLMAATPEHEALAARLRLAVANSGQASFAVEELKNQFRAIIGDAAGIQGAGWAITYKKSRDTLSTDWEMLAIQYGNIIEELLELASPSTEEETARYARAQALYQNATGICTTTKPGSRRFLTDFKEKAK